MTQTTTAIIVTVDHPQFAAVAALLSGTAAPAAPKSEPTDAPAVAPSTGTATTRKRASAKNASEPSADTTGSTGSETSTEAGSTVSAGDAEANAAAYLEVKKRILALSEKDRDAVVLVLKTYGVAKGSELTPDQYPAVIKDLDEALTDDEEDDLS